MPRDLWKSALKYVYASSRRILIRLHEWDTVSSKARDFVQGCLTYRPGNRLSAADALHHPWMKHVSNVKPEPLRIKSKSISQGYEAPMRTYQPGEFLIRQGERAKDEVFLIKSGKVDIVVEDNDTGESVKVAMRETGEFVGEMSVGTELLNSESRKRDESKKAAGAKGASSRGGGDPDQPMSAFQATLAARIAAKKWIGKRRTADVVAATKVECLVLGRKEMCRAITRR